MTYGESLYLILVIGSFLAFATVLLTVADRSHKEAKVPAKAPAPVAHRP